MSCPLSPSPPCSVDRWWNRWVLEASWPWAGCGMGEAGRGSEPCIDGLSGPSPLLGRFGLYCAYKCCEWFDFFLEFVKFVSFINTYFSQSLVDHEHCCSVLPHFSGYLVCKKVVYLVILSYFMQSSTCALPWVTFRLQSTSSDLYSSSLKPCVEDCSARMA